MSGLDGIVDSVGRVLGDLPQTEPNLGHLLAGGLEDDGRRGNHFGLGPCNEMWDVKLFSRGSVNAP